MRNRFDQQLELLNEQLTRMGELCEVAIGKATTALKEGSMEQAQKVIEADEEIDQAETDIERLCLKLLLQQQPVARDLRQISAALKMITDMERIGDQASDIAEIIITEEKAEAQDIPKIIKMSEAAGKMVRDSVNAYVEKDLELSKKVIKDDDVVDELFEEVKTTLIDFIAENKGEQGGEAIDLIMVAKYLEASPAVEKVNYPGLESDACHALAEKYLKGCSGVISFIIKGGRPAAAKFMDSLHLASNEVHVADIRTCVLHPASETHRQLTDEQLVAAGIDGGMIRISVGLENIDDIIEDLEAAFTAVMKEF